MTVRGWRFDQSLKEDRRVLSSLSSAEEVDGAPGPPLSVASKRSFVYVSSDSPETPKLQPDLGAGPMRAAQLSSARWHFGMRAFYHRSR